MAAPAQRRLPVISVWWIYGIGLLPAAWFFYLGATGGLGADPVKTFERLLGTWAIRFLILTLAVSPLRELVGINLIRYRRALGLLTFYYVLMHFSVYLILDQALVLQAVVQDVLKRPFIMFGMAGLVCLIPLALTSNMASIRKMGRNWGRLHRLTYVVALLGALHYFMATKVTGAEQGLYITLLLLLVAWRVARPFWKDRQRTRNTGDAGQARRPIVRG
ncbi:sulfoxide reductase heme-binding subunit YedZ [Rhizobium sp. RU20A]|uniref:protein-methionine-sulfoxide reductase heme-binding subunit MsrQ n=1 Tax=Rhizobium sp. RU20A TaxID=1907412 RepID=UPI000954F420|nr:protein-methionine-sulfoxide reductase heme-binding subunit MsrQ [Rhizobium sp. RU20A]SIR01766.1 sulfoxide reductase heme-binding subunit YedZ [Rhizobium sp. RU20A]